MTKRRSSRAAPQLPRQDLQAAAELYRRFHGKPPRRARFMRAQLPKVAMQIGRLDAVRYASDHGQRYEHVFKASSRPYLVASPDGRTLAVVGGKFQMTPRGIVDK